MHLFHVHYGRLRATGDQWLSTVAGSTTRYATFLDEFQNFLALPMTEVYVLPGK